VHRKKAHAVTKRIRFYHKKWLETQKRLDVILTYNNLIYALSSGLQWDVERFLRACLFFGIVPTKKQIELIVVAYQYINSDSTGREIAEEKYALFPNISRKILYKWSNRIQQFKESVDF
jgi:hypothetical protein